MLDPAIADTISNVLENVINEGTAARNGPIGRPAAGKTGTTEFNRSAWFVGYVPQLAAAVWVGDSRNPIQYPLRYSSSTPDGVDVPGWGGGPVFGGDLPTEVWARRCGPRRSNLPVETFPPPNQSLARGRVTGAGGSGHAPKAPAPPPVQTPAARGVPDSDADPLGHAEAEREPEALAEADDRQADAEAADETDAQAPPKPPKKQKPK